MYICISVCWSGQPSGVREKLILPFNCVHRKIERIDWNWCWDCRATISVLITSYVAYGWLLQSTSRFNGYSLFHFTASMCTHEHDANLYLGVRSSVFKLWKSFGVFGKTSFKNGNEHFLVWIDRLNTYVFYNLNRFIWGKKTLKVWNIVWSILTEVWTLYSGSVVHTFGVSSWRFLLFRYTFVK